MAKRATRHNGRAGKSGVYNPKHNDREFDVENSDHIDMEKYKYDILWNCYHGIYTVADKEDDETKKFEFVERAYYFEKYQDCMDAQNERNEKNGHPERNRDIDALIKNRKTCPEETLLQIGNIDESISPETLGIVATEYFQEFEKRFGEHVHILDWALHLDESTPHIHERHVFDAPDSYGYLKPQQEKALELLDIPLPFPDETKSKFNNRKMKFDSICRTLFIEIAKKHGIDIDEVPIYGGKEYLEKQDYIIAKQKEVIAQKNLLIAQQEQKLDEVMFKISDTDKLIDDVSAIAYEAACDVVADTAGVEAHKQSMEIIDDYKSWLDSPERKASKEVRNYAMARIEAIQDKMKSAVSGLLERVQKRLFEPKVKEKNLEVIKERARVSVREMLQQKKDIIEQRKENQVNTPSKKQNKEL